MSGMEVATGELVRDKIDGATAPLSTEVPGYARLQSLRDDIQTALEEIKIDHPFDKELANNIVEDLDQLIYHLED